MAAALRENTPTEAAAVSEIGMKSVPNAIDKRIIRTPYTSHRSRAITEDDLLRLKVWFGVGSILSTERRKRLFAAFDENPEADTVRADDYLIVDVARAREHLAARGQDLANEAVDVALEEDDVLLTRVSTGRVKVNSRQSGQIDPNPRAPTSHCLHGSCSSVGRIFSLCRGNSTVVSEKRA
ncbi:MULTISPECIES: hypothetical protein [Rhizobium]|uniref:Uncharacterized protein n=1 Tax=Rhizobium favelukesii TaxID=348824 RepID=W6RGI0_9HYPH|nr:MULTISPECIES: hypothetical protein [Rhizobium]MCS0462252.1 hypothetical protein [Rhizobium favelukesii]UFS84618.1 hypothetical protein LPB79_32590 [Rhizobium sp. T136]CDM60327.1 hypothetical protein LPU83_pLPU83b_0340 [Rhizobium favelukesii]